MTTTTDNRRIARNTLYLYLRTFVQMAIGLYTSRKIIEALGVDDFGIYNLVGGIIVLLSFLSGSMTPAVQRYLTVDLGRRDFDDYNRSLNTALVIQIALSVGLLLIAETIGLWFVNTRLSIDPERIGAANLVYQAAVFSTIMSILTAPFTATIIAHERMKVYAWIGLGEASAKLAIVVLLFRVPWDRLSTWAFMLAAISLASLIVQIRYCTRSFSYCRLSLRHDRSLLRSMGRFSGWNLFGTIAWLLRDQGTNILINIFSGGTAINAARGIAMQVKGAIGSLTSGFQNAAMPQMTKSYAAEDRRGAFTLMFSTSKIAYFLLLVPALPICFEATFVLGLWLIKVPTYAALFTILIVVEALCEVFSGATINLLMAEGRIKWYQIIVGSLMLLNIPLSYILLVVGLPIYIPLIVSIAITVVCQTARLLMARRLIELPLTPYLTRVIFRCLLVTALAIVPTAAVYMLLDAGWVRFLTVGATSTIFTLAAIWFVGLDKPERNLVITLIRRKR